MHDSLGQIMHSALDCIDIARFEQYSLHSSLEIISFRLKIIYLGTAERFDPMR